jgi:hypothetical protein
MAKAGDVIILRIDHKHGPTYRVVKIATARDGHPTGYWPHPGAPYYACAGCTVSDYYVMNATQDKAQKYWRGLLSGGKLGHFADFSTSRGAFDAVTGYRLRKEGLRQAV